MTVKAADNRYAVVKWGETKWGPSTARPALAWGLSIDWNQDGIFSDVNEATRLVGLSVNRGRRALLKSDGSGVEQLQVGRLEVVLDNYDGRYDAWNTASPLYPNVSPGGDIRLIVRDLNGSTPYYPVFRGIVNDIVPVIDGDGSRKVRVTADDTMAYLRNQVAGFPAAAYASGTYTAAMFIADLLTSVNWPTRWGTDSTGGGAGAGIPFAWGDGQRTIADQIYSFSTNLFSPLFISAAGKAVLHAFNLNWGGASVLTITEAMVNKDIRLTQPWLNKRNIVRVVSHRYVQDSAPSVIWALGSNDRPSLIKGASLTFIAQYTHSNQPCGAVSVAAPVPTTDWTTNTVADGSGSDLTGSCTLTIVDLGDRARVTLTNNSLSTAYLTFAQLNGTAIYEIAPVEITSPSDASTVVNPRELRLEVRWAGWDKVIPFLPYYYRLITAPEPSVTVFIEGQPASQFLLDLFDPVTLNFPTLGISGTKWWLGSVVHEARDPGCQNIRTTWSFEPLVPFP